MNIENVPVNPYLGDPERPHAQASPQYPVQALTEYWAPIPSTPRRTAAPDEDVYGSEYAIREGLQASRSEMTAWAGRVIHARIADGDFATATALVRTYLRPQTIEYHRFTMNIARRAVDDIQTSEELSELQASHSAFQDFLALTRHRFNKARKPERRQKLRHILSRTGLIDSDLTRATVGATTRLEGPEKAYALLQEHPHDQVTEAVSIVTMYEQARATGQHVPAAAHARAQQLLTVFDPGFILAKQLRALTGPDTRPSGRRYLPIVSAT